MRLSSLQVLRGLAAILVVIHHAANSFHSKHSFTFLKDIFEFGYTGVDLFFVLSGFIIYYIHHLDIGAKATLKPFITKRLIRIYPIYWVVLFLIVPIYFIVPSFGEADSTNISVIIKSFLLFPQENAPVLGVAWTLSHEMLFYLMFALMIFLPKKSSKTIFTLWMTSSLAFFILSSFVNLNDISHYISFIFSPFNLEFLSGLIVAHLVMNYKKFINYNLFIILGITTLISTWALDYFEILTIHRVISAGIPSALLILGFATKEQFENIRIPKILTYLGDASYSIYLTHITALSFFNFFFLASGLRFNYLYAIMIILFATSVGCVFHTIIEKPLINVLRNKFLKKKNHISNDKKSVS
ncbi:acyltransferase family protein [Peribacillus frigoritolerans]|uniref:acyltransferase family protein n=1 Tax=Peribacillus frigoritolerans TaxID=450367 RepID=UPI00207A1592|nr:acyltransferase [Peribacillus frigoritolerans]USK66313.1 acyltransferase [Peribacillus frigoritolerans]